MNTPFFNAHHAPIGAFASFTLGYKGAAGGLGLEIGEPARQNIYIGTGNAETGQFSALPFFDFSRNMAENFGVSGSDRRHKVVVSPVDDGCLHREYSLCTDTWSTEALKFTIYSPVEPLPDPQNDENDPMLKQNLMPAVIAEITVDNRTGMQPKPVFIGFTGTDPYSAMRYINHQEWGLKGIGQGERCAVITNAKNVKTGIGFSVEEIIETLLRGGSCSGLGTTGLIMLDVPAGNSAVFRFAVCFYREGIVTSGVRASYWYNRYFSSIESVAQYALQFYPIIKKKAFTADETFIKTSLSDERRFMLIHAIRSYYGNTQLLDVGGRPMWVVNEGEYRMINTLDLAVDHLFFELHQNPWVIRNILDWYAERYCYTDLIQPPDTKAKSPGGISFTHDMGVANVFASEGTSAYERDQITGCFSYMTHEELVNWVISAGVYSLHTGDYQWMEKKKDLLEECLRSLIIRDHPRVDKRNGFMGCDSVKTTGGAEITTYDSLDPSLGQARANGYGTVKRWAAFVLLNRVFTITGHSVLAEKAYAAARLSADTVVNQAGSEGMVPALFDGTSSAMVLPLVEGVVYPWVAGIDEVFDPESSFAPFIQVLLRHLAAVLKNEKCRCSDGALKLSSTSDITWLSKLYLIRFIATEVLPVDAGELLTKAEQVCCRWLLTGNNAAQAWTDQFRNGEIIGSRYYPRGVTSILWLFKKGTAAENSGEQNNKKDTPL